jgi:hypothetical protein
MKDRKANRLAALLNAQVDRNKLNAPSRPNESGVQTSTYDDSVSSINLVEVVSQLDDDSRAKLQEALDHAKGGELTHEGTQGSRGQPQG